MLSCSSILSSSEEESCILYFVFALSLFTLNFFYLSPSSLSPFFLLCASVLTPLFSYSSLLSSFSLPLLVSPSLCWCCISQRDRLKQMPSWETGYVCVYVCVHALPPQFDSSATCAQRQLPTDGGGVREGEPERQGERGR